MEPTKSNAKHPNDLPANLSTPESEALFEKELEEEQEKIIREAETVEHNQSWWHAFSWKPTDDAKLKEAEKSMLSIIKTPYEQFIVKVGEDQAINTIKMGQGPPLVLLHGFGGGVGIWLSNLDALAQKHTVYAIDILGFGRSSRPAFVKPADGAADAAEAFLVDSLHEWSNVLKLNKFDLLGHSMGGYLSAVYALKYPQKLSHLVLADPWGIPEMPPDWVSRLPLRWRIIGKLIMSISSSPMTLLRAAGPVGPSLIQKLRPDLVEKFSQHFPTGSRAALDYIYHVNAQYPSGEEAFAALQLPGSFSWAAKPLVNRLPALDPSIGVTFLYGEHTWMDKWIGLHLKDVLGQRAQYAILPDAGHHIYVDNARDFNKAVDLALQNKLKQISDDQMEIALSKWRAKQAFAARGSIAESSPAPAPN